MTTINGTGGAQPQQLAAVRNLIERIRAADLGSVRMLAKSLVRLDVPGMLPVMEGLLADENPDLSLAAYDWFARTSDGRALTILTGRLEDVHGSENERWLAAQALGRRGDVSALVSIRRTAAEFVKITRHPQELLDRMIAMELGDGAARLLVRLAVTEAELGGDELAAIPVVLARDEANVGRDPIVRIEAVNALASVAAEGVLEALRCALQADNDEIAEGAIWALQLLGTREAVDALVATATPERMGLAEIALTAVAAVTGAGPGAGRSVFDLQPDELRTWWESSRSSFQSAVCYRCGKPVSLATFVELLGDRAQRPYVANELRIVTGFDCSFDIDVPTEQQDSVVVTARRWVAEFGARFRAGVLYKYGHERSLNEAARPFD